MSFSLEIKMKIDLSTPPKVKDAYITMLPGDAVVVPTPFRDSFNANTCIVK
jgi:translation initiation factor IF-1|tara:strand:+ start:327 stop:479 length:153 start_codon:yes stop_codon:yes gene_type:complete